MRVLVLEDDVKMARLLKKGLEEETHSVVISTNGTDGLDLARTDSFDVIVLDVMLPGVNGFEFARRLRQSNIRTPILMLTARDAVPDVVKALNLGADDYLTKPFDFDVIIKSSSPLPCRSPMLCSIRPDLAPACLTRGESPPQDQRCEKTLLVQ
jgi:DNA-binding response OmpR family regulator